MLLEVKNLNLIVKNSNKKILKNINFSIKKNICLGILGESGSGKSMTCKSIIGLIDDTIDVSGDIIFENENILLKSKKDMLDIRGKKIAMIIQNPMTAFNPLYTIGNQMIETFIENLDITKKEAIQLSIETMKKMKIKDVDKVLLKYPHELSGGMLQRIMIAITIGLKPMLIIADEPTTAIDSLNQKDIIEEFTILKNELNVSILFVTHDLGVLAKLSNELIVMKDGEIVEKGLTKDIIINPKHKHTKYLINTRKMLMDSFKRVI